MKTRSLTLLVALVVAKVKALGLLGTLVCLACGCAVIVGAIYLVGEAVDFAHNLSTKRAAAISNVLAQASLKLPNGPVLVDWDEFSPETNAQGEVTLEIPDEDLVPLIESIHTYRLSVTSPLGDRPWILTGTEVPGTSNAVRNMLLDLARAEAAVAGPGYGFYMMEDKP